MRKPHEVPPWSHTSASQIKTFQNCNAMFWFEKRHGRTSPGTAATERGGEIHRQMEFGKLEGSDYVPEDNVALALLEHVGYERLPREELETKFLAHFPGWPVPFKGVIDLLERMLNRIGDYKSSSNPKRYGHTPETLKHDVQAIGYAAVGIKQLGFKDPIRLRLIYASTRGRPNPYDVEAEFTEEYLDQELERIGKIVQAQQKVYNTIKLAEVPQNHKICHNYYGRACPHLSVCMPSRPSLWDTPTTPSPQESNMSILAAFKAAQAKKASAQAKKADPAPAPTSQMHLGMHAALDRKPNPEIVAAGAKAHEAMVAKQPDLPLVEPKPEPMNTGWSVGDTVLVGDHVTTITKVINDGRKPVVELADGRSAFMRQVQPPPANKPHDPLKDGLNPPDGMPDDAKAPLPESSKRGLRLPEGCLPETVQPDGQMALVSQLKKKQSVEARLWLMRDLGLSEPYGRIAGATKGSAADYKADVTALVMQIMERGPLAPGEQALTLTPEQVKEVITRSAIEPADEGQHILDLDGESLPIEEVRGMLGSRFEALAQAAKVASLTPERVREDMADASVGVRAHTAMVEGHATVTGWTQGKPLLLIGVYPHNSVWATDVATLMAPYYDAVCKDANQPIIGLVKDYQITGATMAAARLKIDIETGAIDLPGLLYADPHTPGMRDVLAVLEPYCAVAK